VSPSGESLLVDTANRTPDDRDAKRIMVAVQQAGLKKIDYLLTTHFHGDHYGALPALVKLIPIGMYFDHGPSVEISRPNVAAAYKVYEELTAGKRKSLKPGDHIPLKGVNIKVVMSGTQAITAPLKGGGAKNPACADFNEHAAEVDPDNGLWATGDMTWELGSRKNFEKLMEYEVGLEEMFRSHPALSGVCQYHQETLPEQALPVALSTHPAVYINETLTRMNPFYSSAGSALAAESSIPGLKLRLDQLGLSAGS